MKAKVICIGALLLGPAAALAAEDALEQARRCAIQQDSLQRLVCYDRVFAPAPSAPSATAVAPAPATSAAPAAALVAGAAAAVGATAETAPVPSTGEGFGSDQLRRKPSDVEKDPEPRTLTGAVKELRETRPDVFRITLDNGQVWQQMDMDSQFHLQAGDTVEISRGRMGGYRMSRQSRGGSGWVRVNRVK